MFRESPVTHSVLCAYVPTCPHAVCALGILNRSPCCVHCCILCLLLLLLLLHPGDEYDRRLGAKSFGGAGRDSSSGGKSEGESEGESESDNPLDIDSDDLVAGVEYAGVCGCDCGVWFMAFGPVLVGSCRVFFRVCVVFFWGGEGGGAREHLVLCRVWVLLCGCAYQRILAWYPLFCML